MVGWFGLKFTAHILYTPVSPTSEFKVLNVVRTATKSINAIYDVLVSGFEVSFLVLLHVNPAAKKNFLDLAAKLEQQNISGLILFDASAYPVFIKLMQDSLFVITDSGGVQEEAPYLHKYTLVLREELEREEVYEHQYAELLVNNPKYIAERILDLTKSDFLNLELTEPDFYGNGSAVAQIIGCL